MLYTGAEATRVLAILLAPFIPSASNSMLSQLGLEPVDDDAWLQQGTWGSNSFTKVNAGSLLFPRIETLESGG